MEVRYGRKFLKQLAAVPDGIRVKIESFVFDELISAYSIYGIGKVEKKHWSLFMNKI